MDCVYHSTAKNNVLVSSHPDYYRRDASGNMATNKYNFFVLDYANSDLRKYMLEMTIYWASNVGIDGCRSDVAVDVPLSFWAALNNELKKIQPSWFMVAETNSQIPTYANPYSGPGYNPGETYDKVYGFDAVYGVRYMGALRGVLEKRFPASVVPDAWRLPQAPQVQAPPGTVFYRAVDNHDQRPRAVDLGAGNSGMVAAMAINFALDGIPFIFNGQEIGDNAATSIQIQRFMSWTKPPARENQTAFRQMIMLRKAHPALNRGTTTWYFLDRPDAGVAFLRQSGSERILVVVSLSPIAGTFVVTGTEDLALTGTPSTLLASEQVAVTPGQGQMQLALGSYGYFIASLQ